jgi:SAM-dependent methyltransferase
MEYQSSASLKPLTSKDYLAFLEILKASSQHFDQAAHFFEEMLLPQLPTCGSFLDIGAGDGILTKRIAPYFSSTTVIEPNPLFESTLLSHGYHLHPQAFLEVPFDTKEKYDFILASHIFYHMDKGLQRQSIQQAYNMLAPQGILLIILRAPMEEKHSFEAEINAHYVNSAAIKSLLNQLGIAFKIHSVINTFKSKQPHVIATLMRFFALTDCLPLTELEELSDDTKANILQLIELHTEKSRRGTMYCLEQPEDYITIVKDGSDIK